MHDHPTDKWCTLVDKKCALCRYVYHGSKYSDFCSSDCFCAERWSDSDHEWYTSAVFLGLTWDRAYDLAYEYEKL